MLCLDSLAKASWHRWHRIVRVQSQQPYSTCSTFEGENIQKSADIPKVVITIFGGGSDTSVFGGETRVFSNLTF